MADDTRDNDMGMRDTEDTRDPAHGDTGMTDLSMTEDTDEDVTTGV